MLLEYSIQNYKMFADQATICMVEEGRVSSNLRKSSVFTFTRISNESADKNHKTISRVNPIGLIYGANGSGKTSLLLSFSELLSFVGITPMDFGPFTMEQANNVISHAYDKDKPVSYSFTVINPIALDYFEYNIQVSEQSGQIYFGDEKLVTSKIVKASSGEYKLFDSKIKSIFERENSSITTDFKELQNYFKDIQLQNTGKDSSVISKIRKMNKEIFSEYSGSDVEQKVESFFEIFHHLFTAKEFKPHNTPNTLYFSNPYVDQTIQTITQKIEEDDEFKLGLLRAFETIDVGIFDVKIDHQKEGKRLFFIHGKGGDSIEVPLEEESDGTRRFISQFVGLYSATKGRGMYLIDELENNYHPAIQRFIIDLFIQNGGQLISTTHNPELMNFNEIPVESIMFIDKNPIDNIAEVYQLIDFEGSMNRSKYNFSKMYEQGRLGAFPRLMDGISW